MDDDLGLIVFVLSIIIAGVVLGFLLLSSTSDSNEKYRTYQKLECSKIPGGSWIENGRDDFCSVNNRRITIERP